MTILQGSSHPIPAQRLRESPGYISGGGVIMPRWWRGLGRADQRRRLRRSRLVNPFGSSRWMRRACSSACARTAPKRSPGMRVPLLARIGAAVRSVNACPVLPSVGRHEFPSDLGAGQLGAMPIPGPLHATGRGGATGGSVKSVPAVRPSGLSSPYTPRGTMIGVIWK